MLADKFRSKFALYQASKIPKPPGNAAAALVPFPAKYQKQPDARDAKYVAYLRANISEDSVPQEQEFVLMNMQSNNVKEKARELKDLVPESFVDLTVQVMRPPFETNLATILWVTDYTSNPAFYSFPDPKLQSETANVCPKGQITMQISCFDEHITHIQDAGITKGTWVSIRNVRIRYGHEGNNLEGFLRGDQGDARNVGRPIKISVLEATDKDELDPRHKAALERCRDYLRAERAKHQAVEDAAAVGRKRKASNEPAEGNAKAKRRAKRQKEQALKAQHNLSNQENIQDALAGDQEPSLQYMSQSGRKGPKQATPHLNPSSKSAQFSEN